MLLSTIAALGTIGSAIGAGISSARRNNQARGTLDNQHSYNQGVLLNRLNSDYSSRTDFQDILSKQMDLFNRQYKREKGTQGFTGGDGSAVYAQKQAAANAVGNATAGVMRNASNYKESAENQLINEGQTYANKSAAIDQAQAQTIAQAGGNAMRAFGGLAEADDFTTDEDMQALRTMFGWLRRNKAQG